MRFKCKLEGLLVCVAILSTASVPNASAADKTKRTVHVVVGREAATTRWDDVIARLQKNGDWIKEVPFHSSAAANENDKYRGKLFKLMMGLTNLDKRVTWKGCRNNTMNCQIQYLGVPGRPPGNPLLGIWAIEANFEGLEQKLPQAPFASSDGCSVVLQVDVAVDGTSKYGTPVRVPYADIIAANCYSWGGERFVIWWQEEDGRVIGEREPTPGQAGPATEREGLGSTAISVECSGEAGARIRSAILQALRREKIPVSDEPSPRRVICELNEGTQTTKRGAVSFEAYVLTVTLAMRTSDGKEVLLSKSTKSGNPLPTIGTTGAELQKNRVRDQVAKESATKLIDALRTF